MADFALWAAAAKARTMTPTSKRNGTMKTQACIWLSPRRSGLNFRSRLCASGRRSASANGRQGEKDVRSPRVTARSSGLSHWLSDALGRATLACSVAPGSSGPKPMPGAGSLRAAASPCGASMPTMRSVLLEAARPILLNGIEDIILGGDIAAMRQARQGEGLA